MRRTQSVQFASAFNLTGKEVRKARATTRKSEAGEYLKELMLKKQMNVRKHDRVWEPQRT